MTLLVRKGVYAFVLGVVLSACQSKKPDFGAEAERLKEAKTSLDAFLQAQGLSGKPADIGNLHGTSAKAACIEHFKKVQKLQTQLDQYTDLTPEQEQAIGTILPKDELRAFRGQYLETAERLRPIAAAAAFNWLSESMRNVPDATTRSPSARPPVMTTRSLTRSPAVTWRGSR